MTAVTPSSTEPPSVQNFGFVGSKPFRQTTAFAPETLRRQQLAALRDQVERKAG